MESTSTSAQGTSAPSLWETIGNVFSNIWQTIKHWGSGLLAWFTGTTGDASPSVQSGEYAQQMAARASAPEKQPEVMAQNDLPRQPFTGRNGVSVNR